MKDSYVNKLSDVEESTVDIMASYESYISSDDSLNDLSFDLFLEHYYIIDSEE